MTLTLEPSPEREAAFKAQSQACGFSVEEWMLEVAAQHVPTASIAHRQNTNPAERARHLDAVDSHSRDIRVLSGEAMSRETI